MLNSRQPKEKNFSFFFSFFFIGGEAGAGQGGEGAREREVSSTKKKFPPLSSLSLSHLKKQQLCEFGGGGFDKKNPPYKKKGIPPPLPSLPLFAWV